VEFSSSFILRNAQEHQLTIFESTSSVCTQRIRVQNEPITTSPYQPLITTKNQQHFDAIARITVPAEYPMY
jgi:hypothetical protein